MTCTPDLSFPPRSKKLVWSTYCVEESGKRADAVQPSQH
jgi:hypothetical protein